MPDTVLRSLGPSPDDMTPCGRARRSPENGSWPADVITIAAAGRGNGPSEEAVAARFQASA